MKISVNGAILLCLVVVVELLMFNQAAAAAESSERGIGRRTKGKWTRNATTAASPSISPSLPADTSNDENALEPLMRECSSNNDCAASYCCTVGEFSCENF